MRFKIGLALLFIGAMMGDSRNLLIPLAILAAGAALLITSGGLE